VTKLVTLPSELSNDDLDIDFICEASRIMQAECIFCDSLGRTSSQSVCPECEGVGYFMINPLLTSPQLKFLYNKFIEEFSQPLPQQGWNDAIRAADSSLNKVLLNLDEVKREDYVDFMHQVFDGVLALLDQQPPANPEPAWRDMESAPKDGTGVRLNFLNVELKTAVWVQFSHTKSRWHEYVDSKFREIPTAFGSAIGWRPLPGDPE